MGGMVAPPRWRAFWPLLALAFALRAAVALGGDSLLHPDEVQQYLEPAHALPRIGPLIEVGRATG